MIKEIKEINFPSYATLSQATVSLNDMGDKTISAQVDIDGSVVPDFSYDWEVEFQGETYIHPIREPQASKGNDSAYSHIELTFYHKTIYELKRYYFVKTVELESGVATVDKYISPINLNLGDFCIEFQKVLDYYYGGDITVDLNPEWVYDKEVSNLDINYTYIWDLLSKVYDIYGVRWHIEGNIIRIGYPTTEVSHIFEYGFDGGLLKVERQVQSSDIRNSLLGRGSTDNLPYRYFKEEDTDAQGYKWAGDPDAIPELANVYFTELRGKTFRDYVKGWKAKHYGGTPMDEPTEEYLKGYNDEIFNPIEYVEDKESIAKYGLLQGGLQNNEDIKPSIQGVTIDPYGRIDQIVGAEKVLVDEDEDYQVYTSTVLQMNETFSFAQLQPTEIEDEYIIHPDTIYQVSGDGVSYIVSDPQFTSSFRAISVSGIYNPDELRPRGETRIVSYRLIDVDSGTPLSDTVAVPSGLRFTVEYRISHKLLNTEGWRIFDVVIDSEWYLLNNPFNGVIVKNINTDGTRKFASTSATPSGTASVKLNSDVFDVGDSGATNVDVMVNIIPSITGEGAYEWTKSIEAVNVATNEVVSSVNMPRGSYFLRVTVDITNRSADVETYKVQLMPSYVYFPTDVERFKPTFAIWVKNIWGTQIESGETAEQYAERVWRPILGDKQGDDARVCFSSGWLSGHDSYEFPIVSFEYAGDSGVELDGVKAEWKLTLAKSDAEMEAIGKWIPSTAQQANAGDYFFFLGIDMPHQYVLWAEEKLDIYKREELRKTANIKPTWVVHTDKVRLNTLQSEEQTLLLDSLRVGSSIRLADSRFISGAYELLYLQSVTYTWSAGSIMLPEVEVVLSDKVETSSNPVSLLQNQVDELVKQVGSLSNIQQVVRAVGDKLYLRKDGISDTSNSQTEFARQISSVGFRSGNTSGIGWGARIENGQSIVEADTLIARKNLVVSTIVSNQISYMGGEYIVSSANIECSRVEKIDENFRCYFTPKNSVYANLFAVGDIAYSQTFDADNASVNYYKRRVIGVGEDYIDLSGTDLDGDGFPQVGDVIVQFGNFTDESRQGIIVIASFPTPSITQYVGVNSFTLPNPATKISPNDNEFTGKVHIGAGSTGANNLSDLPDIIQDAIKDIDINVDDLQFGKYNLLRNTAFTGDYVSPQLGDGYELEDGSQMFSPSLEHWNVSNAFTQQSEVAESRVEVVLSEGSLSQTLKNRIIVGENYVLSFKAKGETLTFSAGGVTKTIALTDEYTRYIEKFTASSETAEFAILNATCTMCELQLERGTVVSAWGYSMWDNQSELAYYQSLQYLSNAIKNGSTDILGGLVLTNMLMLGNYSNGQMSSVTSGVSGVYNGDDDVAFWGGGTHEQAIATVTKYLDDPTFKPTKEELAAMAKYVVTHGGRAILNDVILRGYIYAEGGTFGNLSVGETDWGDVTLKSEITDEEGYHYRLDINPEIVRLAADREEFDEYESVSITPLRNPDKFDLSGLLEVRARENFVALSIPSGYVAGLRHTIGNYVDTNVTLTTHTAIASGTSFQTLVLPSHSHNGTFYEIINANSSGEVAIQCKIGASITSCLDATLQSGVGTVVIDSSIRSVRATFYDGVWYLTK